MIKPMASVWAEQRITLMSLWRSGRANLFFIMVGLELCLLLSVLVWLLLSAPPRLSLTTTPDLTRLTDEIQGRLSGLIIDPVIEVKPGVIVRSSNVRGFHYEGNVYYYYIEGAANYDPLSRGLLRPDQVEIILCDDSGNQTIVIYRVQ